jgi:hypothetical protein
VGVSEWLEHGRKYKYVDYWLKGYVSKSDVRKTLEQTIQSERFSGAPFALNKAIELLTPTK